MGPKFGEDEDKTTVITRAPFRNHWAVCIHPLKYKPCLADLDVWMNKLTKPDGTRYYGYIMLLYVDDALYINHEANSELVKLDGYFKMKPGSIGDPDIYLGAKITDFLVDNDVNDEPNKAWGL